MLFVHATTVPFLNIICSYIRTHTFMHMYACMHACMYVCMHMCVQYVRSRRKIRSQPPLAGALRGQLDGNRGAAIREVGRRTVPSPNNKHLQPPNNTYVYIYGPNM